jgi:UDP-glucose 4-epimerase
MDVVVTGGAGFIGANLCRRLAGDPMVQRLVVLDDLTTGRLENLADIGGLEIVEGSILDPEALAEACDGASSIVHLAARPSVPRSLADPVATHEANASGTVRVLEAARNCGAHVVVASSSSVYGANPELPKHEGMAPMPASPYAASKLATEAYAVSYGRAFGLPVLAFRFFNVFGPLQAPDHAYAAVIPIFLASALRGEPLPIHGDGRQTRDFTYVGTVVSVLADAVLRKVTSPDPVNLAFGSRVSLLEVVEILESLLERPLARDHLDPRPGDVRDSQADQRRFRALFPDAEPVPLEEGLRRTLDWFRTGA